MTEYKSMKNSQMVQLTIDFFKNFSLEPLFKYEKTVTL